MLAGSWHGESKISYSAYVKLQVRLMVDKSGQSQMQTKSMQMLQFSSLSPSNHLMSIRAPNADFPGQEFNSLGNTLNGLKGKKWVGEKEESSMKTWRVLVSSNIVTLKTCWPLRVSRTAVKGVPTCLPAYRSASFPLTKAWTSSGLEKKTYLVNCYRCYASKGRFGQISF